MEWLIYLSKVSVCMGLFYAFYHFFLQKLTFFSINRVYLLLTLLLSFVIPALQFEIERFTLPTETQTRALAPLVPTEYPFFVAKNLPGSPEPAVVTVSVFEWQTALVVIYWLCMGLCLVLFLIQLTKLIWFARRVSGHWGRLKIIDRSNGFANCSFLNYVFIDCDRGADEVAAILHHESIHAFKLHSLDKLLIGFCKVLLWFNPFIYLYAKALELVHEYEADQGTAVLVGNSNYANLLLSLNVSQNQPSDFVHSFVKSPLKERIKMLFTNPSKNMKKLTYLNLVPAALAMVWLFDVQIVYAEIQPESKTVIINKQQVNDSLSSPISTSQSGLNEHLNAKKADAPDRGTISEAPIRLIDNFMLGDDPWVTIDGKKYTADILTRISPACVKSVRFESEKVDITTSHNQLEYATKAEIETAKVRKRVRARGKFYNRYRVTIGGRKYDEILVRLANGFAEAPFPVGYRIALFMNEKIITENEALKLTGNNAYNMTSIKYIYASDHNELFNQYGDKYDLIMQFTGDNPDSVEKNPKIIRGSSTNMSEDYYGRFEYSAKDSTLFTKDKRYVLLYGAVRIYNGHCSINADKIRFDLKSRTIIAKDASFTFAGTGKTIEAPLVKIDIDKGNYELLSGTPDF